LISAGKLTYLAKPVNGVPERDGLGLLEVHAAGSDIVGRHPPQFHSAEPDLDARLFGERLDDLF
jgi:hypothetical protein